MNNTAKALLERVLELMEGAYAPTTIRAYKSNFEAFIHFCEKQGHCDLPATGDEVADYVSALSGGHLRSASIRLAGRPSLPFIN